MYAQLGNIIFKGLNSFNSYESTDETNYAQHDLINAKPVLKPTGNNLEELAVEIKLRAEFINVDKALLAIKKYKDDYEVLPLIKGNGQYIGDFVITSMIITDEQTLGDGTRIAATLQLTLLEFVTADKLQQQQSAARKQAFALGDKKPVSVGLSSKPTIPHIAAADVSAVNSQAFVVDRKVSEYSNNINQRPTISDRIQSSLQKMQDRLESLHDKLDSIPLLTNAADIKSQITIVKSTIQNFTFPITGLSDLQNNNRDLQAVLRNLGRASASLINLVITRAA